MKFGIHNPSWLFGPDPAEAFVEVKAKAQWAENHGFVWFSVMDHLIQIGGVGAPDEPFMEGWTVLSALAAVTSRIRLATLATSVGYRNPAHLAKIAAGVDLISRGRLTLGIGAGYLETEYRQYGWEFPARPAVRIRQMAEAVRLILALWTEHRTTFHGRYFHVEDAILEPKPVQKPRPPVMIAGGGEQLTLRAVARLADACNIGGEARAAGTSRTIAGFCRHRVGGDRPDRPVSGGRRAIVDQQRLPQRRRNQRAPCLRCHAALCLTVQAGPLPPRRNLAQQLQPSMTDRMSISCGSMPRGAAGGS